MPEQRLGAWWNGRLSKQERNAANKRLTTDQELAICQYVDYLDTIGTVARTIMITSRADSILRRRHTDATTPPPTIRKKWARRFLDRHPEYYVRKQKTLATARKNSHDLDHSLGLFQKYKAICDEKGTRAGVGFRVGVGKDL